MLHTYQITTDNIEAFWPEGRPADTSHTYTTEAKSLVEACAKVMKFIGVSGEEVISAQLVDGFVV